MKIKANTNGITILGYFKEIMIIMFFKLTLYVNLWIDLEFFSKVTGFYIDLSPLLSVPNYSIYVLEYKFVY